MYGAGIDNPIALKTNGQTYYYHTDEIGSVVALSNSANQLEEQYSYGPFGQSNDIGHVGNPLRYTARRLDSETGRYYYRARYYEPQWGKFLQADPLGYADGMNAYAYVGHDPVNFVDPYGTTATRGGYSSSAGNVDTGSAAFGAFALTASGSVGSGSGALATGVRGLLAGGSALGVVLSLSGDTANLRDYTYVTYTRFNPATKDIYSGRTGGFGTPQELVTTRSYGQQHLTNEGFLPPVIDRFSSSRGAIRGREQQLIDFHGGARSVGGSARNAINGVADFNPLRPLYIAQSIFQFGSLPDRSPSRRRFGWD